jgi:hypothetical protein
VVVVGQVSSSDFYGASERGVHSGCEIVGGADRRCKLVADGSEKLVRRAERLRWRRAVPVSSGLAAWMAELLPIRLGGLERQAVGVMSGKSRGISLVVVSESLVGSPAGKGANLVAFASFLNKMGVTAKLRKDRCPLEIRHESEEQAPPLSGCG